MSDYQAAPEDWTDCEQWAVNGGAWDACILELRARVEALEKRCETQLMQLSDLQERHHRLTLQVGHLEHELVKDDDEPQQHCLEAMDPPEANSKPTPNDRQIRSSLLERVAGAIADDDTPVDLWHDDARAAIREVAAWLREHAGGTRACWLLDVEAKQ